IGRYTDAQLALISDFLTRMEQVTKAEATTLRETPEAADDGGLASSEHSAPVGALREARLAMRSGLSELRLGAGADPRELYRAASPSVSRSRAASPRSASTAPGSAARAARRRSSRRAGPAVATAST